MYGTCWTVPLTILEPWGACQYDKTASDTVLSTEAHHRARNWVERTFQLQSHSCPDQTMSLKSHRENLLPLGTKDQSWFLSEVSHRAGSKSCSFNTEAQIEELLLPSKGRKRKNPGESVRAFSSNQPSETPLPPGPTSDLCLVHSSSPRHQTQKGPPLSLLPASPLPQNDQRYNAAAFSWHSTVTWWHEVDNFPKTQTSKCNQLRNKCYLIT